MRTRFVYLLLPLLTSTVFPITTICSNVKITLKIKNNSNNIKQQRQQLIPLGDFCIRIVPLTPMNSESVRRTPSFTVPMPHPFRRIIDRNGWSVTGTSSIPSAPGYREFRNKTTYFLRVFYLVVVLYACQVTAAPWTWENQAWNVNFERDGSQPHRYRGSPPWSASASFNTSAHGEDASPTRFKYHPSPEDWRSESIYQLITDRFSDGQPDNNQGFASHFGFDGYELRWVNTRHGGDFVGITQKLYYIKSLGYSGIWISPVFQNMDNSYHGYAQIDFTLLDERFGTLEEFRQMVRTAHSLGMYVLVDIVVNHMADLFHAKGYVGAPETPFHMHLDEYHLEPHFTDHTYKDFWINNNFHSRGHYGPVYNDLGQRQNDGSPYQGSFFDSDFHHNGDLRDSGYSNPWNNHLGKIYGIMDDLRTTHPRVTQKLIAMTRALITSTDIDGIRVDTPMQVPLSFFQDWVPAIRSHAASLGKRNFGVFAEFYCTRERGATMTGRGVTKTFDRFGNVISRSFIGDNAHETMDGGIHYPFYFWLMNTIRDQQNDVAGIMRLYDKDSQDYDFWNPRADWKWQYRHWHFFNNHDQWRLAASTTDGVQKTQLASAILAFWPGIPVFYYGDEQGFNTPGTALDGWAREDFMTSLAWKTGDCCKSGYPSGCNRVTFDNFDQTAQTYLYVSKLMEIRSQYAVLSKCDSLYERWHQVGFTNGLYGYTRACGMNDDEFATIIWNTWRSPLKIPAGSMYSGWRKSYELVNVMDDGRMDSIGRVRPTESIRSNQAGYFAQDILVEGYEVKVFVKKSTWKPLRPKVVSIQPGHDQFVDSTTLANRLEVKIEFNSAMIVATVLQSLTWDDQSLFPDSVPSGSDSYRDLSSGAEIKMVLNGTECTVIIPRSRTNDGIHFLGLLSDAASTDGISMNGLFKSRIRIGNAATNVLMNTCLNGSPLASAQTLKIFPAGQEDAMRISQRRFQVQNSMWSSPFGCLLKSSQIRLRIQHTAYGASKFRVRAGNFKAHQGSVIKNAGHDRLRNVTHREFDRWFYTHKSRAMAESSGQAGFQFHAGSHADDISGPWTSWMPYGNVTDVDVVMQKELAGPCGGLKTKHSIPKTVSFVVQYYVDGSSAYFVTGSSDL